MIHLLIVLLKVTTDQMKTYLVVFTVTCQEKYVGRSGFYFNFLIFYFVNSNVAHFGCHYDYPRRFCIYDEKES